MFPKSCLFILLSLLMFSCENEEAVPQKEFGTGKVNFSDLKIGQQSTYLAFAGFCLEGAEELDQFFPVDTLILEVVDMNGEVLTFSERLTEGSTQYQAGLTQTITYDVIEKENYLLIPVRDSSALFYFYANDTLHLNPSDLVDLRQENLCYLMIADSVFTGDEVGLVKDFKILNNQLDEKIAVSCVPPFLETVDNGYLLYDNEGLGVSYIVTTTNDPNPGPFGSVRRRGWVEAAELE